MESLAWWRPRAGLHRFLADLVADELFRLRRRHERPPSTWTEQLSLVEDLGVDSLELLSLAGAVAEALHLHASGIEDYLLARRRFGEWLEIAEAGLERHSATLTFRTSGSTGAAKSCVHGMDALWQEARFQGNLFAGRQRILCAVPAHHIYGFLFTVLLPAQLGMSAAQVIDIRGSSPAWLAQGARPGDLVVAHPDYWQLVARTVPRLPEDVVGVTSTAPCPDATAEAVAACGLARLFHIYGSSETAGIGWRDAHAVPYALMPHWRFEGDSDLLVRTFDDGTSQAVQAQDLLEAIGERHFLVGSRRDHAVQVGGINVFPERVREVLLRHPRVQDAAVRLMAPTEGTRLKAFVVPSASGEGLVDELARWIDTQLAVPERPKAITVGDALPRTHNGKLADWPI